MNAKNYIANAHPAYIESVYDDYKTDANSIDPEWRKFFEGFEFAQSQTNGSSNGHATAIVGDATFNADELKVYRLIEAYRDRAHLLSDTNPIRKRKDRKPNIDLNFFGLSDADLTKEFAIGSALGLGKVSLQKILDRLKELYCGSIGFEFNYITDTDVRDWFVQKIESRGKNFDFDIDRKKHILHKLNQTVVFEQFLGTKYRGEKRFSLEGGESTIPGIDAVIDRASALGVKEVAIGMAHRGRLNVLVNILGKTYKQIFSEFEKNTEYDTTMGDGDVKYHLGFSAIANTYSGNDVQVKLVPNPSHLEAVNPVVEGFARAKADLIYDSEFDQILPVLIHGDAAVAGQGVVYEVLQMSKLAGYYTGGTIHFIINNQIGFTTDFDDARSSHYSTSVAATVQAPVIHVNGDDAEAVVYAADLAAEYRQKFHTDIFIDMVCYRKHGHNEADEPKFTQPQLYNLIDQHPNPRDMYSTVLTARGDIEAELAKTMDAEFRSELQERLDEVKQKNNPYKYQDPEIAWRKLRRSTPKDFAKSPETGISKKAIDAIIDGIKDIPAEFSPLKKINRILKNQAALVADNKVDWALGELLAYGSLMLDGHDIRMSGQDVKRGTFSHRHSILHDINTADQHNRLNHISGNKNKFRIYNSLLSEFAVLGFEFGYSLASPDSLVIWEAQFGDFANGAQTMIDQFITSSESKWRRMSGLVMLLPHGYEGMGPEHSSARLERFLQACAEENIAVANITTPANFFHAIRRQLARPFRKPLVVMSPKSLLRHPECRSSIDELQKGRFQEIIDQKGMVAKNVKRVLCCSGKIYYDLLAQQKEENRKDVAIVRIEQLYPLADGQLDAIVKKYKSAEFVWVQEEPENMGAWAYLLRSYRKVDWKLVARKVSASPATGYKKVHLSEQADLVERSFNAKLD